MNILEIYVNVSIESLIRGRKLIPTTRSCNVTGKDTEYARYIHHKLNATCLKLIA